MKQGKRQKVMRTKMLASLTLCAAIFTACQREAPTSPQNDPVRAVRSNVPMSSITEEDVTESGTAAFGTNTSISVSQRSGQQIPGQWSAHTTVTQGVARRVYVSTTGSYTKRVPPYYTETGSFSGTCGDAWYEIFKQNCAIGGGFTDVQCASVNGTISANSSHTVTWKNAPEVPAPTGSTSSCTDTPAEDETETDQGTGYTCNGVIVDDPNYCDDQGEGGNGPGESLTCELWLINIYESYDEGDNWVYMGYRFEVRNCS